MGARKGQNNFGKHQRRLFEENLRKVQLAVETVGRRRKADFADLPELLSAVATQAKLHPTTVARNPRYHAEVMTLVARKPRLLRNVPDDELPLASLKAKSIEKEFEVGQLKRENARLRALIERRGAEPALPAPGGDPEAEAERHRRAFERTATVLGRLLAHLAEGELGILLDGGEIRDITQTGPRKVIAGSPDTDAYVKWWRRQPTTRDQDKGGR